MRGPRAEANLRACLHYASLRGDERAFHRAVMRHMRATNAYFVRLTMRIFRGLP